MPILRNSIVWIPFYLFIVVFILFNFKNGMWYILFAIFTVILTDFISSDIIKKIIYRPRPCNDLEFVGQVRLLASYCGANSSFTSSHAANHFGLATFLSISSQNFFKKNIYYILFFWAFTIIFAQVYVGVHYPIDVFAGAIVGILAGFLMAKFFKNKVPNFALRIT
jgi:undecaprenyl-diphosphatase